MRFDPVQVDESPYEQASSLVGGQQRFPWTYAAPMRSSVRSGITVTCRLFFFNSAT